MTHNKRNRLACRPAVDRRIPGALALLVSSSLFLLSTVASASDEPEERFTLSAGAYSVFRYESSALLTSRDFDLGVGLNPENVLGLDSTQTVLQLNASYRFNSRHALEFSWYRISTDSSLSLRDEIEWVDENGEPITIPIDASVSSKLKYEIAKVGYLWRFYESELVSLSAGAGLHSTRVSLDLRADSTSSGASASRASTSLPLPVLSFRLDYSLSARFGWFMKAEVFALSFGDWSGTYDDIQLGIEYRLLDRMGVGAALGNNALRAVEKKGNTRFEYENRITGALLYLKGYF